MLNARLLFEAVFRFWLFRVWYLSSPKEGIKEHLSAEGLTR
jgi:hypothetical protein